MKEKEKVPPPEHLRCKRTDGRQWQCKRRAMDGKTLCDIHYLQGKHRQNKEKVPDSLKLERKVTKKRGKFNGESSKRVSKIKKMQVAGTEKQRRRHASEALDETLKRVKLKRGDLELELIRIFLKRQVEKKKEKELKENETGDETRELPYGVMAISQSSPSLQNHLETGGLDVKLGVDSNCHLFLQRHFRSKNIEPLPVSTMQVVPFAEYVKKKKMKKCHWCRASQGQSLIMCSTCRKRFFCFDCIKERYFVKKEVKDKCPACLGICSCELCTKQQHVATNHKESCRGEKKLERIQLLRYLIYMLLPVLKQINCNQSIELEAEAKIAGKGQSDFQIPQAKLGVYPLMCCNKKCKMPIVDYHRACASCSYSLCLSCFRELSGDCMNGSFELRSCKRRKVHSSGDELYSRQNVSKQTSGSLPYLSLSSFKNWEASADGPIPCPPTNFGGCGQSLLNLRCMYPFNWTRDLEARAEDILSSYLAPASVDVSSSCLLCNNSDPKDGEIKPQREMSSRSGFSDHTLYCPTVQDLRQEALEHFQSHWGKGQPVMVRDVIRRSSCLCWDPVFMFCSYMDYKSSESCNTKGMKMMDCFDWCEVEIDKKLIFMGSLEKRAHASVRQKVLKFKAWLSVHLFQKQFPAHYNEILNALPLREYINPLSGLLNMGVKLPKELPKPELGPSVYFSYGGRNELMQGDCLSKLSYESHDMVNILAYATDAPISQEQIGKIENLMKKYKARDYHGGKSFSNSIDNKAKSSLQSEDTGESGLQEVGEKGNLPNGIENVPFYSSDPLKCQMGVENGNFNDDSESDAEASILCTGSIGKSEDSDDFYQDVESSCSTEHKQGTDSCGAQWDIFHRQDVPKLLEYLRRHSNEFSSVCSYSKQVHPILDQNFFLDAYHKLRLKEEFDVQPWTLEQCHGEAIFVPAGCPYQVRNIKSCVNVVLDFISPEHAAQCIQLNEELRCLPTWHKARRKVLEVEKMALHGISTAIEELCDLKDVQKA